MLGFVVIVILYAVIGFMAVAGAIFIARKFLAPKAEQIFFAMFLIMIAAFYLALAAYFRAATAWRLETAAVLAFVALGLAGVRLPLALIIGYPLHGLWDVLHELQAHGASSLFEEGQLTADGESMDFYAKYVLPHLIDVAMRNKETARLRAAWIPHARGEVLEVGIGSGLNLAFYSSEVQHVYGVDPSVELGRIARKRAAAGSTRVEFLSQSAEEPLPLANSSMDTVVVTWTLCSITNAPNALQEMKRVLKPSGRLIFLEHGRAPDPGVVVWQDRLTPVWKRITGGCHLNRRIDELITEAGFRIAELSTCYLPGPRPMSYTYQGLAELV